MQQVQLAVSDKYPEGPENFPLQGTEGVPRSGGRKTQLVLSCVTLLLLITCSNAHVDGSSNPLP